MNQENEKKYAGLVAIMKKVPNTTSFILASGEWFYNLLNYDMDLYHTERLRKTGNENLIRAVEEPPSWKELYESWLGILR